MVFDDDVFGVITGGCPVDPLRLIHGPVAASRIRIGDRDVPLDAKGVVGGVIDIGVICVLDQDG